MTHAQFLRIKKLTGKAIIEVAARHNHREILAELGAGPDGHIDPARGGRNRVLRGQSTAAGVASEAQALMDGAGVKAMRKDAVRALEIIFSLPPVSPIDHDRFFNESVQWAGQYFAAPVISAIVHNDEAAPHCHVLLLPLVNGRMVGSDLMGGRAKLQALQADFHTQVGQRHGLARQTAQKRPSAATRKQAMDSAFDVLEATYGISAEHLLALLAPHAGDPAPLLLALGLTMPTSTGVKGSFVQTMTKPCKPEKPIGFGKKKPIGFDGSAAPENEQTLSCVGFGKFAPPFPPPNEPTSASKEAAMTSAATFIEQANEIEPMPPQAAIIESIAIVPPSPEPEPLPTAINDATDQPATRIEPSTAPAPQPIDPRQRGLFDLIDTPASTSSNQPAHDPHVVPEAAGKREYRVSDERRNIVRAILLDPERAGLGDRAISREAGVSAAIIRVMRRSIAPAAGKVLTFERGGKTYTMDAANIGKRPAAHHADASGPVL